MPARHGCVGNICTLCIRAYAQMLLLYNSPVMVYICGKNMPPISGGILTAYFTCSNCSAQNCFKIGISVTAVSQMISLLMLP